MKEYQSLSHTRWDCKYHIVFIPKYRKKLIYGALRKHLGEIFRELAKQRECGVVEGHLIIDHVHMSLNAFDVSHKLDGCVRIDGDALPVSARVSLLMIDCATGTIAWSRRFDCPLPLGISQQEAGVIGMALPGDLDAGTFVTRFHHGRSPDNWASLATLSDTIRATLSARHYPRSEITEPAYAERQTSSTNMRSNFQVT